jgi:hypothetical protein
MELSTARAPLTFRQARCEAVLINRWPRPIFYEWEVTIMKRTTWNSPIRIEDPETGIVRTVKTIRDAKTMLARAWPAYHGSQHGRAEKICDDALHGNSDPAEARRAFIAAAVEAHFHIQ